MLAPPQLRRRRSFGVLAIWVAAVAAIVFRTELADWVARDRGAPPGDPAAFYTCSMDPSVDADRPGICPLCGMALTPVSREDAASGIVRVAPSVRQQIGLAVGKPQTRQLRMRISAVGEVVAIAGDRASVLAQVYRGDAGAVAPGAPLTAAVADRPLVELGGALEPPLAGDPPGALRAAIASPGFAGARSTPGGSAESIASPGFAGARSTPGGSAESIASPGFAGARSTPGGSAESIASPGFAGARSTPGGSAESIDNPDQVLRPHARVELRIEIERAPCLAVPAEAVLYAGPQRIALVDLGHGRYEPRAIKLGAQAGGFVEVTDGLTEDNRVVVRGAFLLAADSRIRSDGALWADRERSRP